MSESMLSRFFGVVTRAETWLNVLFHILAFPLGLFYFVFLVTGLSVGIGLVVVWVGIPILLLVAGAWWLFAAFERVQAQHLLGADVSPAPRAWESAEGVWAKLKAHFGSGTTWKDLAYLLAKLVFGVVSFTLIVALAGMVAWLAAFPVSSALHVHLVSWSNGQGWTPPVWLAILAIPGAVLLFVASLHVINAWGWVCARWAEVMLGRVQAPVQPTAPPPPLVSTAPSFTAEMAPPPTYPTEASAPQTSWPAATPGADRPPAFAPTTYPPPAYPPPAYPPPASPPPASPPPASPPPASPPPASPPPASPPPAYPAPGGPEVPPGGLQAPTPPPERTEAAATPQRTPQAPGGEAAQPSPSSSGTAPEGGSPAQQESEDDETSSDRPERS